MHFVLSKAVVLFPVPSNVIVSLSLVGLVSNGLPAPLWRNRLRGCIDRAGHGRAVTAWKHAFDPTGTTVSRNEISGLRDRWDHSSRRVI
jgi:hypothetical protein